MKKTLEQVLIEQAEQMEKSAEAIRLIVAKSKEAGIEWPETEETIKYNGITLRAVESPSRLCNGCYFYENNIKCELIESIKCTPSCRDDHKSIIYKIEL